MKKTLMISVLAGWALIIGLGSVFAADEFKCVIRSFYSQDNPDNLYKDYTSLSSWEYAVRCDLTDSRTKVFTWSGKEPNNGYLPRDTFKCKREALDNYGREVIFECRHATEPQPGSGKILVSDIRTTHLSSLTFTVNSAVVTGDVSNISSSDYIRAQGETTWYQVVFVDVINGSLNISPVYTCPGCLIDSRKVKTVDIKTGSLVSGDKLIDYFDANRWVILSNSGNSACVTAQIDGAWTYSDTAVSFSYASNPYWRTSSSNYISIYTTPLARHSGKWDEGKYRIVKTSSGTAVSIDRVAYISIDGLQVYTNTGAGHNINYYSDSGTGGYGQIKFSNLILRSDGSNYGIYCDGYYATIRMWNNIIYTDSGSAPAGGGIYSYYNTTYCYVNTVYNKDVSYQQGHGESSSYRMLFKNCVSQKANKGFYSRYGYPFLPSSDFNVSDIPDDAPNSTFPLGYGTVKFKGGDDFHLSPDDRAATGFGIDLSGDLYIPASSYKINYDIDDQLRRTELPWDIGADQGRIVRINRSVEPLATGAIKEGDGNNSFSLSTTSVVANFSGALPDDIGVGDIIVYNNQNSFVFISCRGSSNKFLVHNKNSGYPTQGGSFNDWNIYRPYISLENALNRSENTSVPISNFDTGTGGIDITVMDIDGDGNLDEGFSQVWQFVCYDGGEKADITAVIADNWVTSADNYIRIFTPVTSREVGIAQGHTAQIGKGYRLAPIANDNAFTNYIKNIRIEGLAIGGTNWGSGDNLAAFKNSAEGENDVRISNCFFYNLYNAGEGFASGYYSDTTATGRVKLWNNIFFSNIVDTGGWGIYPGYSSSGKNYEIYNNTVVDMNIGIQGAPAPSNYALATLKNNLVQGGAFNYLSYFGSTQANISSDETSPNADRDFDSNYIYRNQDISFVNRNEYNFHLKSTDTAVGKGTALTGQFLNDIDNDLRDTAWDIGADECVARHIYRSVEAGRIEPIVDSAGGIILTISETKAVFSQDLSADVGLGDGLKYKNNNGVYVIVFIYKRISAKEYLVQTAAGGIPSSISGGNDWGIYRAYLSLANALIGAENPAAGLAGVRDFDSGVGDPWKNLVQNRTARHIACYGNAVESVQIVISGWTTDVGNYLRIFTPVERDEAGRKQRHRGVWTEEKYRISVTLPDTAAVSIASDYVRLEGLQISCAGSNGDAVKYEGAGEIQLQSNILRGGSAAGSAAVNFAEASARIDSKPVEVRIWNNIIYDFGYGIYYSYADNPVKIYLCNNTIIDCLTNGVYISDTGSGWMYSRDNLVQGTNGNYSITGLGTHYSNYNISQDGTSPDSLWRNKTIGFVNETNKDFHLDVNAYGDEAIAISGGENLRASSYLSFQRDIDSGLRPLIDPIVDPQNWDIGADQTASKAKNNSAEGYLWSKPGTWETGVIPAPDTEIAIPAEVKVVFDGDYTQESACGQLTIEQGGTLEFEKPHNVTRRLTLAGDLIVKGKLIMRTNTSWWTNDKAILQFKCDASGDYGLVVTETGEADIRGHGQDTRDCVITAFIRDGSHNGYILIQPGAQAILQYTEISYMGANISNKYGVCIDSAARPDEGAGVTIFGCAVHHGYRGIYLNNSLAVLCGNNDIYFNEKQGVYLDNSSNNSIYQNVIHQNKDVNVNLINSNSNFIYQNTINGDDTGLYGSHGIYFNADSSSNLVKNNIITNHKKIASYGIRDENTGLANIIDYNLFYNNVNIGAQGDHSQTTDNPSFNNYDNNKGNPLDQNFLYLNSFSPALGRGADIFGDGSLPPVQCINKGARLGYVVNQQTTPAPYNSLQAAHNDSGYYSQGVTITAYTNDVAKGSINSLVTQEGFYKYFTSADDIVNDGDYVGCYLYMRTGANKGRYHLIVYSEAETDKIYFLPFVYVFSGFPDSEVGQKEGFNIGDKFTIIDRVYERTAAGVTDAYIVRLTTDAAVASPITWNTQGTVILDLKRQGLYDRGYTVRIDADYTDFSGFIVQGSPVHGICVTSNSTGSKIEDCIVCFNHYGIRNSAEVITGCEIFGHPYEYEEYILCGRKVLFNNVYNNGCTGIYAGNNDFIMGNNVFNNCYPGNSDDWRRYALKMGWWGSGTRNQITVKNNNVFCNYYDGIGIVTDYGATDYCNIFNNVVYANRNYGINYYSSSPWNVPMRIDYLRVRNNIIGLNGRVGDYYGLRLPQFSSPPSNNDSDFNYFYSNGNTSKNRHVYVGAGYLVEGSNSLPAGLNTEGTVPDFIAEYQGTAGTSSNQGMIVNNLGEVWEENEWVGAGLYITAGPGTGNWAGITSNSEDRLYFTPEFGVVPSNSTFIITRFEVKSVGANSPLSQGCDLKGSVSYGDITEPVDALNPLYPLYYRQETGIVNMGSQLGYAVNDQGDGSEGNAAINDRKFTSLQDVNDDSELNDGDKVIIYAQDEVSATVNSCSDDGYRVTLYVNADIIPKISCKHYCEREDGELYWDSIWGAICESCAYDPLFPEQSGCLREINRKLFTGMYVYFEDTNKYYLIVDSANGSLDRLAILTDESADAFSAGRQFKIVDRVYNQHSDTANLELTESGHNTNRITWNAGTQGAVIFDAQSLSNYYTRNQTWQSDYNLFAATDLNDVNFSKYIKMLNAQVSKLGGKTPTTDPQGGQLSPDYYTWGGGGTLGSCSITHNILGGADMYALNTVVDTQISFTTQYPVPAGGDVVIEFNSAYDLSQASYGSGNSGAQVRSEGNKLIIILGTTINGPAEITVRGIRTPVNSGSTGTYKIRTRDKYDVIIDTGTALANTIGQPSIDLIAPSDAEIQMYAGQIYPIEWYFYGDINEVVKVYYTSDGFEYILIAEVTADGDQQWTEIGGGRYSWDWEVSYVVSTENRIRVKYTFNDNASPVTKIDTSGSSFEIINPSITVTSPGDYEYLVPGQGVVKTNFRWIRGDTYSIEWNTQGLTKQNWDIICHYGENGEDTTGIYTKNDPEIVYDTIEGNSYFYHYNWNIPAGHSTVYTGAYIEIIGIGIDSQGDEHSIPGNSSLSPGFKITEEPLIEVTEPSEASQWYINTTKPVQWKMGMPVSDVNNSTVTLQFNVSGGSWVTINNLYESPVIINNTEGMNNQFPQYPDLEKGINVYNWPLLRTLVGYSLPSTEVKVKIYDNARSATEDITNWVFSIKYPEISNIKFYNAQEQEKTDLRMGAQYEVKWNYTDGVSDKVLIEYYAISTWEKVDNKGETLDPGVVLNDDGSFEWEIPQLIVNGIVKESLNAKIRIRDFEPSTETYYCASAERTGFSILKPKFDIVVPASVLRVGGKYNFSWQVTGTMSNSLKVYYIKPSGTQDITDQGVFAPDNISFVWSVPVSAVYLTSVNNKGKFKVQDNVLPNGQGESSEFDVYRQRIYDVSVPQNSYILGTAVDNINWRTQGKVETVKIQYSPNGTTFYDIASDISSVDVSGDYTDYQTTYDWAMIPNNDSYLSTGENTAKLNIIAQSPLADAQVISALSAGFTVREPRLNIALPSIVAVSGKWVNIDARSFSWRTEAGYLTPNGSVEFSYVIIPAEEVDDFVPALADWVSWQTVNVTGAAVNSGSSPSFKPDDVGAQVGQHIAFKVKDTNSKRPLSLGYSSVFEIVSEPWIEVFSPQNNMIVRAGTDVEIKWDGAGSVSNEITIKYSITGGDPWTVCKDGNGNLAQDLPAHEEFNPAVFMWRVPAAAELKGKSVFLKIIDAARPETTMQVNSVVVSFLTVKVKGIDFNTSYGNYPGKGSGERYNIGDTVTVNWGPAVTSRDNALVKVWYSVDAEHTLWQTIPENSGAPNDGVVSEVCNDTACYFDWTVPDNISANAKLRVTDPYATVDNFPGGSGDDTEVIDTSDNNFKIVSKIVISQPSGGTWIMGTDQEVRFEVVAGTSIENVKIWYHSSADNKDKNMVGEVILGEVTATPMSISCTGDGPYNFIYNWLVPSDYSVTTVVYIEEVNGLSNKAQSASFTIGPPQFVITYPTRDNRGFDSLIKGESVTLCWQTIGVPDNNVKIEIAYMQDPYGQLIYGTVTESYPNSYIAEYPNFMPTTVSESAYIRISENAVGRPGGQNSAGPFEVKPPAKIKDILIKDIVTKAYTSTLIMGKQYEIIWGTEGLVWNELQIYYTLDASVAEEMINWVPIIMTLEDKRNDGSFLWAVPAFSSETSGGVVGASQNNVKIKIRDEYKGTESNPAEMNYLTIQVPEISVARPKGGEIWAVGDIAPVEWIYNGAVIGPMILKYDSGASNNWNIFADASQAIDKDGKDGPFTYNWTVASVLGNNIRVQVLDYSRSASAGNSGAYFSVIAAPTITVTSLSGGFDENTDGLPDSFEIDEPMTFNWQVKGLSVGDLTIEYWNDVDSDGNLDVDETLHELASGISRGNSDTADAYSGKYTGSAQVIIPIDAEVSPVIKFRVRSPQGFSGYPEIIGNINQGGLNNDGHFRIRGGFSFRNDLNPAKDLSEGAELTANTRRAIVWYNKGTFSNLKLEYRLSEDGENWNDYIVIKDSLDNTVEGGYFNENTFLTTYPFSVPDPNEANYPNEPPEYYYAQFKVTNLQDESVYKESEVFHITYYTIEWKIKDYDTYSLMDNLSVRSAAGEKTYWLVVNDSLEVSMDERYSAKTFPRRYPYCVLTTFWEKTGYFAKMDESRVINANMEVTIAIESFASAQMHYKVFAGFAYNEDTDVLTVNTWMEKKGTLIRNVVGLEERLDQGGDAYIKIFDGTEEIYEITCPQGSDSNGNHWFVIENVVGEGGLGLISGKTYFSRMAVYYSDRPYESGTTFEVTISKELKELADQMAQDTAAIIGEVVGVKTTVVSEAQGVKAKVASEAGIVKDTIVQESAAVKQKVSEVKTETASILTAVTQTLPQEIDEVRTEVIEGIKPHVRARILNLETQVKSGDTVNIQYQSMEGLTTVKIDVYNSDNKKIIDSYPMIEGRTKGIYEYPVTFSRSWRKGDFSIVCSESTYGTMDSIVMTVVEHDIDDVAGSTAAILGSTSNLQSLNRAAADIESQIGIVESVLSQIGRDIVMGNEAIQTSVGTILSVDDGGDSDAQKEALKVVFSQLDNISKQIKELGATEGINLEKVYEVSKDKKDDMRYLKNKTEELKATVDLSKKILENAANKPVVQTWFEFR